VFAAGCTARPTTNNSGTTTITVIGTGPNNQTAAAILTANITDVLKCAHEFTGGST